MATNKRLNGLIVAGLLIVALYFIWSAIGSSSCALTGINDQTRTSWAPTTGCVIQGSPMDSLQIKENR
ncbi:hypothetical protein SLP22_0048 [Salmonella phage BAU.Micro_SLP-22]|nr:hypothetical protein SLP22_00030 [Salmonella phage BAU.Micro_SLP-22]